jgi:hypothetical protein
MPASGPTHSNRLNRYDPVWELDDKVADDMMVSPCIIFYIECFYV